MNSYSENHLTDILRGLREDIEADIGQRALPTADPRILAMVRTKVQEAEMLSLALFPDRTKETDDDE